METRSAHVGECASNLDRSRSPAFPCYLRLVAAGRSGSNRNAVPPRRGPPSDPGGATATTRANGIDRDATVTAAIPRGARRRHKGRRGTAARPGGRRRPPRRPVPRTGSPVPVAHGAVLSFRCTWSAVTSSSCAVRPPFAAAFSRTIHGSPVPVAHVVLLSRGRAGQRWSPVPVAHVESFLFGEADMSARIPARESVVVRRLRVHRLAAFLSGRPPTDDPSVVTRLRSASKETSRG